MDMWSLNSQSLDSDQMAICRRRTMGCEHRVPPQRRGMTLNIREQGDNREMLFLVSNDSPWIRS